MLSKMRMAATVARSPVRNAAFAASLIGALTLATVGSGEPQTPDWQKDRSVMDIELDLSKERTTLALKPQPGDTEWPYYNNHIDGNRFSPLNEISLNNVGQLEEACRVKVSGVGPFAAGPVMVAGTIYTTAWRTNLAIQASNCDVIWKSIYTPDETGTYNNRGVAWLDGRLFRGTGDGRLVSYDAATGRELWRTKVGDPARAEFISGAPLAWNGMVFVGLAAGDFGIAGRVTAHDALIGKLLWTFNTVPHRGEFGNDTWPGDSWKDGGGGTWSSFTLDEKTG